MRSPPPASEQQAKDYAEYHQRYCDRDQDDRQRAGTTVRVEIRKPRCAHVLNLNPTFIADSSSDATPEPDTCHRGYDALGQGKAADYR